MQEYCDREVSGSKARRPGVDTMMADARRGAFSVVLVAAFDRIARSTKNFLEIVDELNELGIEFISAREAIDTSGPMGRNLRAIRYKKRSIKIPPSRPPNRMNVVDSA